MEEVKRYSKHIVLLRFSALGDIAIAAPLLREYAANNRETLFTMVSPPIVEPLFAGIENLSFFPVFLKDKHRGIRGMYRLSREVKLLQPNAVADLHSVLRTFIVRFFLIFSGIPFSRIDKGRKDKKMLTRKNNKVVRQLDSSMARYEKVINSLNITPLNFSGRADYHKKCEYKNIIGIAPFAKHKGKQWPLEYMEEVVSALSKSGKFSVFLFGGGEKEVYELSLWERKFPGVKSFAGIGSLCQELQQMKETDLMICMDSSNMHFASSEKVPVISVWGATHPFAGFYGWGQDPENAVMAPAECRPCSVFGNKECFRGDYICLNGLKPAEMLKKIYNYYNLIY